MSDASRSPRRSLFNNVASQWLPWATRSNRRAAVEACLKGTEPETWYSMDGTDLEAASRRGPRLVKVAFSLCL